jgi:predicted NAD/FAD-dependent oxidoreductase
VVFAGDYLGGPFIEGAVTSGIRAADRLLRSIET